MGKRSIGVQIMRIIFALMICSIISSSGYAQAKPKAILPDSIHWSSSPIMPGVQAAWLVGAMDKPGLYILRVKIKAGTIIPPHTHPDDRNTTVLSGTIYVGFGEVFDKGKMVAVPVGAVYLVPANIPHYIWAKDGDAIYQESGNGPTANKMIGSK